MSWDISIHRIPEGGTIADALKDGAPPLGPAVAVRHAVASRCPVDWTDPQWGVLDIDDVSIEFNVGAQDPIESMMLHIRGEGDPMPIIADLCKVNGWGAIDMSEGPIDLDNLDAED